jgi:Leucine-rich repeat (LRR) protein
MMVRSKTFTLRTVSLISIPFCIFMSWCGCKIRQSQNEHGAVERLLALDATILNDYEVDENGAISGRGPPTPQWISRWCDKYLFQHVACVRLLPKSRLSVDDIQCISAFRSLRELRCEDTNISDSHVAIISQQKNLKWLSLANCPITDKGLYDVSRMNSLRELNIAGTNISDMHLDSIAAMRDLVVLDVSNTTITDDGVMKLSLSRSLRVIVAFDTTVSEKCVLQMKASNSACEIVTHVP